MTWRMWTQNYENIKLVQGASVKTNIVKCRFQDQEDAGTPPEDENSIEGAGGAAATPAAGAAEAAPPACGEERLRSLQLRLRLRLRLRPPTHLKRQGERDRRLEADAD